METYIFIISGEDEVFLTTYVLIEVDASDNIGLCVFKYVMLKHLLQDVALIVGLSVLMKAVMEKRDCCTGWTF
jgi:hypothetical protein